LTAHPYPDSLPEAGIKLEVPCASQTYDRHGLQAACSPSFSAAFMSCWMSRFGTRFRSSTEKFPKVLTQLSEIVITIMDRISMKEVVAEYVKKYGLAETVPTFRNRSRNNSLEDVLNSHDHPMKTDPTPALPDWFNTALENTRQNYQASRCFKNSLPLLRLCCSRCDQLDRSSEAERTHVHKGLPS